MAVDRENLKDYESKRFCAQKYESFIKNANFKTDLITSYMADLYVFIFI